jgi:hypothetical protein
MAYEDDDAHEFTGTTQAIKANPPKPRAAVASTPVAPVAPKPGSHAKVAIVGPRKAWMAATQETADARTALIAATAAHRAAENAESDAMIAWSAHPLNRPSPDEVTRAYLQRETQMRIDNKAAGRPVDYRGAVAAHDPSPITQAALARGRHAGGTAQKAGTPLRGNTARRTV